jgi:hypothetical protein
MLLFVGRDVVGSGGASVRSNSEVSERAVRKTGSDDILHIKKRLLIELRITNAEQTTHLRARVPFSHSARDSFAISFALNCHDNTKGRGPSRSMPASPQRRVNPSGLITSGSSSSAYSSNNFVAETALYNSALVIVVAISLTEVAGWEVAELLGAAAVGVKAPGTIGEVLSDTLADDEGERVSFSKFGAEDTLGSEKQKRRERKPMVGTNTARVAATEEMKGQELT